MLDGGWTAGGGAGGGGGDAIGVAVAVVVAVVVVVVVVVVLVVVVAVHVGGVHRRPHHLHRVARPRALHWISISPAQIGVAPASVLVNCQKHNLSLMIRARSERQKHNQGYDLACQTTRPRGGLAPV
jgi:hypothetical protein